jgi:hypothetical protein
MLIKMASSHLFLPIMIIFGIGVLTAVWYFVNKNEKEIKKDN